MKTVKQNLKRLARNKMKLAIENFKQAELEGAEDLAPLTFRWAKVKIYNDRKILLNSKSNIKKIEDAVDDASAAAAQLLSSVRKIEMPNNQDFDFSKPDFIEQEAIDNLINEGGTVI